MKRFWLAVLAVFLANFAFDFAVHGVLLAGSFYAKLPHLFLQQPERTYPALGYASIPLSELIFAGFFVTLYGRVAGGGSRLMEGLRYGGMIWGLAGLVPSLAMYGWSRFPGMLLAAWIAASAVQCVLLGWVCAAVYRPGAGAHAASANAR